MLDIGMGVATHKDKRTGRGKGVSVIIGLAAGFWLDEAVEGALGVAICARGVMARPGGERRGRRLGARHGGSSG